MKYIFLFLLFTPLRFPTYAQLNIQLLHQLVQHSKDENQIQIQVKDKQSVTTTNEQVNKSKMTDLKVSYRKIQQRFRIFGLAIQTTQIGISAAGIIEDIIKQQQYILRLAENAPFLTLIAFHSEKEISKKIAGLSRYLYGLALSYGDLNQMKQSDRKILLENILTELRSIAGNSRALASTMRYVTSGKYKENLNPFSAYINKDRKLVENILQKIKRINR